MLLVYLVALILAAVIAPVTLFRWPRSVWGRIVVLALVLPGIGLGVLSMFGLAFGGISTAGLLLLVGALLVLLSLTVADRVLDQLRKAVR